MKTMIYILSFIINFIFLIFTLNPLFAIIQGIFMVGLMELTHQCVHRNITRNKILDNIIGTLSGAFILIHFSRYSLLHIKHHAYTCKENDPELPTFYKKTNNKYEFLLAPYLMLKTAWAIFLLHQKIEKKNKLIDLTVSAVISIWIALLLCILILKPITFAFVYLIPFCVYCYLDYFFTQAEHYGIPWKGKGYCLDQASITNDIYMPKYFSWLVMNRNFHKQHHTCVTTRWHQAYDKYLSSGNAPDLFAYPHFIKTVLTNGPRNWEQNHL